jgi:hypothetical protein
MEPWKRKTVTVALVFVILACIVNFIASCTTATGSVVPVAPVLISPSNNSTVGDISITYQWNASDDASNYWLTVSTSSNPLDTSKIKLNGPVGDVLQYTDAGYHNNGTAYYWWVNAGNNAGWALQSEVLANGHSFVNGLAPAPTPGATPTPSMIIPSAPTLVSPGNGANVLGTSITYQWNASTGATDYRLMVSTNSDISDTSNYKVDITLDDVLQYTDTGYPSNGATFYWWVNAGNSAGWASQPQVLANGYSFINRPVPAPTPAPTRTQTYPSAPTPVSSPGSTRGSLSAPTMLSPADDSNVSGTGIVFKWSAVSGATHYLLEINTDSDWGAGTRFCYLDRLSTSVAITGFPNNGTTYYWRVSAGNSDGWGTASAGRSFVNGSAPISTPTPAYTTTPAPTPGSTPAPIATPTPAILPAPVLLSPGNGTSVSATGIIFKWSAVSSATHYLLEINTDPGWGASTRFRYIDWLSTSVAVTGFPNNGTTYYWRVSAGNSNGWGTPSAGRSFLNGLSPTTTPAPGTTPTPTPTSGLLQSPVLISPGNGTNIAATGIIFKWSAVSGATHYLLEVNTDPNWGTGARFRYIDWLSTSVAVTGFPNDGTTYYWRVSAGNSNGWGNASQGWSLVNGVGTASAAPTLLSPGNGTGVAGPVITLQWSAPVGVTGYRLEVNTDPDWGVGTRLYYGTVGTTSQTVTGFSNDGTTKYYWRVWASNAYGWSAASDTWNLISRAGDGAPATPTSLTPAEGSSEPGTSITFRWNASSGATRYIFEINTDPNWTPGSRFGYCDIPSNFVYNELLSYNIVNNSLVVAGLPNGGTTYYWRVWAGNSNGWSAAASSSLVNGTSVPPATPVLSSPGDGATVVGASINFRWSEVGGATQYLLEVNTDPGFGTGTRFYYANVSSYSQTVSGFPQDGTTYYWRVTAGNSHGWSSATAGWSMVNIAGVVSPITTAPTLMSPAQGGVVMGFPVTFSWNSVEGATKYRLLATRPDGSKVVDTVVGGVTSYTPPDLKWHFEPFIYLWKVWAGNDAGWCPDAAVQANQGYFLHLYMY